jgi:hypothetical protein
VYNQRPALPHQSSASPSRYACATCDDTHVLWKDPQTKKLSKFGTTGAVAQSCTNRRCPGSR